MDNNKRFINSFKELEDYLINLCKKTDYLYKYIASNPGYKDTDRYSFRDCINAINYGVNGNSSKVKTVRSLESRINKIKEKKDFIEQIQKIRNKLSHETSWFDVTNDCITELDKLCDFLFRIKIKDVEQVPKQVKYCSENDKLFDVINIMYENKFTHIPIISERGEVLGVFSDAVITIWLKEQIDNNGEILIDTKNVSLGKIVSVKIKYEEYLVMSDNEQASEAYSKFEDFILKGNRLGCILFTKDGTPNSSITGIMTAWDLPIIKEYFLL